ncbi:hypothetical protein KCU83_g104, partial [Aureobasidium melanogenum]
MVISVIRKGSNCYRSTRSLIKLINSIGNAVYHSQKVVAHHHLGRRVASPPSPQALTWQVQSNPQYQIVQGVKPTALCMQEHGRARSSAMLIGLAIDGNLRRSGSHLGFGRSEVIFLVVTSL